MSMKAAVQILSMIVIVILLAGLAAGQTAPRLDDLEALFDSTRTVEAHIFAPKNFGKAEKALKEARRAMELQKKQQSIDRLASEFREYAENALKATEVAKLSLSEYLEPRKRAIEHGAPQLVPELYRKAEQQFLKATGKIESGNVKGGLLEAEKSASLFDTVELEAIKAKIMGEASRLIEKSVADKAGHFALATLNKARTAFDRCDGILDDDRYNRKESLEAAALAEYEARHASNIAQSVRSLERNNQAWEKLILLYEIEMRKVADELEIASLPFDKGPGVAADSLKTAIKTMKAGKNELEKANDDALTKLKYALEVLDATVEDDDLVKVAGAVNEAVAEILVEKEELSMQLEGKAARLTELQTTHAQVASELEKRREMEEKIKKARSLLNPIEAEVLLNATDDVVLRLFGLSFASGKSDIKEEHVPLLQKVEEIIRMFPDSKLMIEGHTDDRGERKTNMRLSEKRAYSVMQYLRGSLSIPADKIRAVGLGPDKPIGTNTTAEGRAKNRRIDIVILQ